MERTGRFLVVDGIAGSGKTTILKSVRLWMQQTSRSIFDLKEWSADHSAPPLFEDVSEYDVLFTFEPTRSWVGSAIREELSRVDDPYNGREIAHAFSLDRQIMYKRLILPALAAGKTVIQDRSVTSSLVYQPIQDPSLTVEEIAALPGNHLALRHAPDFLILTQLDPELAVERMQHRQDDSKGVYEQLALLKKVDAGYRSEWFHTLMKKHGTTILPLDTSTGLETVTANVRALLDKINL